MSAAREQQKRTFSVSLSGPKGVAAKQIGDQVKDASLAKALKALVASAPGNAVSVAGDLESSEDGSTGKISITGTFETISEEALKAHADANAPAGKARRKARRKKK